MGLGVLAVPLLLVVVGEAVGEREAHPLASVGVFRDLWTSCRIPYDMDRIPKPSWWDKLLGRNWEKSFTDGMKAYEQAIPGLKFFEKKTRKDKEWPSWIVFEFCDGSNAPVGRQVGENRVCINTKYRTKGRVMHELAHSLGLHHEQTRYDRDLYVHLPGNPTDGNNGKRAYGVLPYDYKSVTHYPDNMIPGGFDSSEDISQDWEKISDKDREVYNFLYNRCVRPFTGPPKCMAGVDTKRMLFVGGGETVDLNFVAVAGEGMTLTVLSAHRGEVLGHPNTGGLKAGLPSGATYSTRQAGEPMTDSEFPGGLYQRGVRITFPTPKGGGVYTLATEFRTAQGTTRCQVEVMVEPAGVYRTTLPASDPLERGTVGPLGGWHTGADAMREEGYLTIPVTASYTFWLRTAGPAEALMWLGCDGGKKEVITLVGETEGSYGEVKLRYGTRCSIEVRSDAEFAVSWSAKGEWERKGLDTTHLSPPRFGLLQVVSPVGWSGIGYLDQAGSVWGKGAQQVLTGMVVIPTTGDYTFWVASDSTARLLLGVDVGGMALQEIVASQKTGYKVFTHMSSPLRLQSGPRRIRVEHTAGDAGHLTVAWTYGNMTAPEAIPPHLLLPGL